MQQLQNTILCVKSVWFEIPTFQILMVVNMHTLSMNIQMRLIQVSIIIMIDVISIISLLVFSDLKSLFTFVFYSLSVPYTNRYKNTEIGVAYIINGGGTNKL